MKETIPEKWYLPKTTNEEEAKLICAYINESIESRETGQKFWVIEDCKEYHPVFINENYKTGYFDEIHCREYTKISFEEFKTYILDYKESEPEPKIEENYDYLIPILNKLNKKIMNVR